MIDHRATRIFFADTPEAATIGRQPASNQSGSLVFCLPDNARLK